MKPLSSDDLRELGVAEVGERVFVDATARLINPGQLRIGSDVRIDAFAVLSAGDGGIVIGDHVHIAAHVFLAGTGSITIADFAGLSGRVSIYSSNDDYSGDHLTGPTVPMDLRGVTTADVLIGRHAIIGAGSVVLPGVRIGDGSAVGALSLVNADVAGFTTVAGTPARVIGTRSKGMLALEQQLRDRQP
ncbi:MAG: acyltransferase [Thermoleophilia bacterium]|nr:acyltransferase [Thermoleophilia bacterium]